MLGRGAKSGIETAKLRPLLGFLDKFLGDFFESGRFTGPSVLNPEFETACRADTGNCRRSKWDDQPLKNILGFPMQIRQNGPRVLGCGFFLVRIAFFEWLEGYEKRSGIGFIAAVQQAVTGQFRTDIDTRNFFEYFIDGRCHFLGAIQTGGIGHENGRYHIPLIFARNKAGRQRPKQMDDGPDHQCQQQKCDGHAFDDQYHGSAKRLGESVEAAIEPGEKSFLTRRNMPEEQSAHGRCQGEGHKTGYGDGYGDGDRKLLVELACRAGQKCGGNKHRRHDQHRSDDRAGHLSHGPQGGILWGKMKLGHVSFNILHHHDGVIHHDADGQHEAKEGKQIDGKPQHKHTCKCTDQRHEYGDRADDRGAEIL